MKGKWCGTLGISREILEEHDRLGTLGIRDKFLGMAPLELRMEVLEGHDQLDTRNIIKGTIKYNQYMKIQLIHIK